MVIQSFGHGNALFIDWNDDEQDAGFVPGSTFWYQKALQAPYKVFSNIPFNITSAIVARLANAPNPPEDTCLVLQIEQWLRLFETFKAVASPQDAGTVTASEARLRCQQGALQKFHRTRKK